MAVKHVVTCIVRAASGHLGKIVLPSVPTIEAAKAFLTNLAAFHEGSIVSISHSETESQSIATGSLGTGNTDRKGIIVYRDNTVNATRRLSIPAWGFDAGDAVLQYEGERIPLAACDSVVENLQNASGHDLTAIEGYVIQRY